MATGFKFVNGDFVIENKQLVVVENYEKTKRDFVKFLTTDKETTENKTKYRRYNPNYGTEINRLSLYKNLTPKSIMDAMEQKLGEAIQYYVKLQESRKNLSLSEVITDIEYLVYQDLYNKQKINFQIKITTASSQSSTLNLSQEV